MILIIVIAILASEAKAITKICIVDSGVSEASKVTMCNGKYDKDEMGHGTNVAKTIAAYAGDNYCIKSYKVFYTKEKSIPLNLVLDTISFGDCDIINLSIDSDKHSNLYEYMSLYRLSLFSKMFISAGNKGMNLDKRLLFPVGYSIIPWTVVGNTNPSSNRGKIVKTFEKYCEGDFCGTSASVAIATGKYVKGLK